MLKAVRSLLSASAVYGLGTAASKFIGFFLLPVFTRYLLPSEYGLFETFNVILLLMNTVGVLGMDSAMMRFYYDAQEDAHRRDVVSTAFVLTLVVGIAIAGMGALATPWANQWLFPGQDHRATMYATMIAVVGSIVNTAQLALFQTKREPGRYSVLTFVRFVLMYGLSVLALMQGLSVFGLMLSQVAAFGGTLLLGFVYAKSDIRLSISWPLAKDMMRFSAPLIVGGVSIWLLSSSDRFFLLRLSTLHELGLYSLGSRLASLVLFAVTAFQMAWPQFALSRIQDENSGYTMARILTYYLFVGILLVVSVSLFTPEILRLMATSTYEGAGSVVTLLSCSFLFYGCYFVISIIMSITKNTLSILPVTVPPLIVSLLLNFYLVPVYGGIGSALASTAAYFLMAVLAYVFTRRLRPVSYEWNRVGKMISLAVIVLSAGKFIAAESLIVSVVVKLGLVAGYLGGLFAVGFFLPTERETIASLIRRKQRTDTRSS